MSLILSLLLFVKLALSDDPLGCQLGDKSVRSGFDVDYYTSGTTTYDPDQDAYGEKLKEKAIAVSQSTPIEHITGLNNVNFALNYPNDKTYEAAIYGKTINVYTFGLKHTGYFMPSISGEYTFNIGDIDDFVMISIGDGKAFSCCGSQSSPNTPDQFEMFAWYDSRAATPVVRGTTSKTVYLQAGYYYPIKILYDNVGPRDAKLSLSVTDPAGVTTSNLDIVNLEDEESSEFCPATSLTTITTTVPTLTYTTTTTITGPGGNNTVIIEVPGPSTVTSTTTGTGTSTYTTTVTPSVPGVPISEIVVVPGPSTVTSTTTGTGTSTYTTTVTPSVPGVPISEIVVVPGPSTVTSTTTGTGTSTYTTTVTPSVPGVPISEIVVVAPPSPPVTVTSTDSSILLPTTSTLFQGSDGPRTVVIKLPPCSTTTVIESTILSTKTQFIEAKGSESATLIICVPPPHRQTVTIVEQCDRCLYDSTDYFIPVSNGPVTLSIKSPHADQHSGNHHIDPQGNNDVQDTNIGTEVNGTNNSNSVNTEVQSNQSQLEKVDNEDGKTTSQFSSVNVSVSSYAGTNRIIIPTIASFAVVLMSIL